MDHNNDHAMMEGKTCNCGHHKVGPILMILIGLDFFLAAINVLTGAFLAVTWPILVIIWGFVKLAGNGCACCKGK